MTSPEARQTSIENQNTNKVLNDFSNLTGIAAPNQPSLISQQPAEPKVNLEADAKKNEVV